MMKTLKEFLIAVKDVVIAVAMIVGSVGGGVMLAALAVVAMGY